MLVWSFEASNATDMKKGPFFDLDFLRPPTRFRRFFSFFVGFRFLFWFEIVFFNVLFCLFVCLFVFVSMGCCWHMKLWSLENCMRALLVNGSGQCNVTRRRVFILFNSVIYLTYSFKIWFFVCLFVVVVCFLLFVFISLAHIFSLTVNARIVGVSHSDGSCVLGRIQSDVSSNIPKKVYHIVTDNFVNLLHISYAWLYKTECWGRKFHAFSFNSHRNCKIFMTYFNFIFDTICVPYIFRKSIFGWNCDHDTPLCDTPLLEDTPPCDTPDGII